MKDFVCSSCGFTFKVNRSVCPNCHRNFNLPIETATRDLSVVKVSDQKGRGVISNRRFNIGDLIESCPVLVIPPQESEVIQKCPSVWFHMFPWNEYKTTEGARAIAMGYGMLYNHSKNPNAHYKFNNSSLPSIDFYALKGITEGEEITIYYADKLWFEYEE